MANPVPLEICPWWSGIYDAIEEVTKRSFLLSALSPRIKTQVSCVHVNSEI